MSFSTVRPLIGLLIGSLILNSCGPSLDSPDAVERLRAVRDCEPADDAQVLIEIALSDRDDEVRQAAVEMLVDDDQLLEVALGFEHHALGRVRLDDLPDQLRGRLVTSGCAAAKRIRSEAVLLEIVTESSFPEIVRTAASRLEKQEHLKKVMETVEDPSTLACVVPRVTDEEYLRELALNGRAAPAACAAAVTVLDDPEVLGRLAITAAHWQARAAAVDRLEDPTLLVQVALASIECDLRLRALGRLSGQTDLATIARRASDWRVRQRATERVEDPPVLAGIARDDADWMVCLAAVKQLKEEEILKEIAASDADRDVRCAAVERLQDKTELLRLADKDADAWVRLAASIRLADQGRLLALARTGEPSGLRRRAAELVTDPALQKRLLEGSRDEKVHEIALTRVTDVALLLSVVEDPRWYRTSARKRAAAAIQDQDALVRIVSTGTTKEVLVAAIGNLTHQDVLARIALEYENEDLRRAAIQRLTDQAALLRIVDENEHPRLAKLAASRLEDQAEILRLVRTHPDPWVRGEALRRLTSERDLKTLIEEADETLKGAAIGQLTDQEYLNQLLETERDRFIRVCVVKRLTDPERLAHIAETEGPGVRGAALDKITDPEVLTRALLEARHTVSEPEKLVRRLTDSRVLARLAMEHPRLQARRAAIETLSDDEQLGRIALEIDDRSLANLAAERIRDPDEHSRVFRQLQARHKGPAADGRYAGLRKEVMPHVADPEFLLARSRRDPSPAVRLAAVETLADLDADDVLIHIAIESEFAALRKVARRRVNWGRGENTHRFNAADQALYQAQQRIRELNDQAELGDIVLEGAFDVLRNEAAERLTEPDQLVRVIVRSPHSNIRRICLGKLEDPRDLERILAATEDPALRLAVEQKLGNVSWEDALARADGSNRNALALGDVIGAMALYSEGGIAPKTVVKTCHRFIAKGDASRIPELTDLLRMYGDKSLAEDYLNCGQPDLYDAAGEWARRRGLSIGSGGGSNRVRWGSRR